MAFAMVGNKILSVTDWIEARVNRYKITEPKSFAFSQTPFASGKWLRCKGTLKWIYKCEIASSCKVLQFENIEKPLKAFRLTEICFPSNLARILTQPLVTWSQANKLTIIERGWVKYLSLSAVARRRSLICPSQRLRQIIDLRDIEKSWYFAITEFNNIVLSFDHCCFNQLKMSNHSLTARGSFNYAWADFLFQMKLGRVWANIGKYIHASASQPASGTLAGHPLLWESNDLLKQ